MNLIHEKLYNEGERLIPFVSHDVLELQRHYSSYVFFKDTILKDIQSKECNSERVTILELGFGVGHGTKMLAEIPGAHVTAIDNSEDCRQYALKEYYAPNIDYRVEDIAAFLAQAQAPFDYIISRGVMEHVPDGVNIMRKANYKHRVMFDVPYNEKVEANDHHLVTRIKEEHFADFENAEFLYEDLKGMIFSSTQKPEAPNLIMCVCTAPGMKPIEQLFSYPVGPRVPPFSYSRYFINNFCSASMKQKGRIVFNEVKKPLGKIRRSLRALVK